MPKQDDLIDLTIPTDPELSNVEGRNGTFRIEKLWVWESHDRHHVYLDGIGKRGVAIRGGLCVTKECFEEICRRYLQRTRGHVILQSESNSPDDDSDCKLDAEGFCVTHDRMHLRERAAAMEVPAGDSADQYHLVECDKSFCPTCSGKATLLCSDTDPQPAFYICWDCKTVAEVGVGPIQGATHEV